VTFGPLEIQDYFFQQRAQQFFTITVRSSGCPPDLTNIGAEHLNAFELLLVKPARPLLLASAQLRFGGGQIAQAALPLCFQTAGHQPILRLHGTIAALDPFGFVARTFHFQPPLRQSGVVVGLELFDREPHGLHGGRRDGFEKSIGYGLLDGQTADVETVLSASIYDVFAGAVVTGRRVSASIMCHQTPTTMAAGGDTLQQGRALSHRPSRLMRLRSGVGIQPRPVGLVSRPIDETGMMLGNEDGPLSDGQMAYPFPDAAVCIDVAFILGLAVGISASIHRIGQNVVDGRVSRRDPGPACTNRPIRQDYLDTFVWSEIIRLLEGPELIQTEIDRRREAAQKADPLRRREEELLREKVRVEKTSERLVTAYQEGLLTLPQLRQRMPPLQKQTQAVESELQSLKMAAVDEAKYLQLAESLAGFRSKLRVRAEALDIAVRQQILRLLVKEVLVGGNTITLRHSIPIPQSGPASNGSPGSTSAVTGSRPNPGYLLRSGSQFSTARQRVSALICTMYSTYG